MCTIKANMSIGIKNNTSTNFSYFSTGPLGLETTPG